MDAVIKDFVRALLSFDDEKALFSFLEDVMTCHELEDCAIRWKVARMLSRGISYQHIQEETGLSTTTIARISKWLQEGSGGYKRALVNMGL